LLEIFTVSVVSSLLSLAATAVAKDVMAPPQLNPTTFGTLLIVGNLAVAVTMGVMVIVAPSPTPKQNPAPGTNPMVFGAS
jgi:hypothetical protein